MFYNRLNDALHPDSISYRARMIIGAWIVSFELFHSVISFRDARERHDSSVFRDGIVSRGERIEILYVTVQSV